jgi:hypothetical protein
VLFAFFAIQLQEWNSVSSSTAVQHPYIFLLQKQALRVRCQHVARHCDHCIPAEAPLNKGWCVPAALHAPQHFCNTMLRLPQQRRMYVSCKAAALLYKFWMSVEQEMPPILHAAEMSCHDMTVRYDVYLRTAAVRMLPPGQCH